MLACNAGAVHRLQAVRRRGHKSLGAGDMMFLVVAILLAVAYVIALIVVHTAGFLIHILIILAVVSLILHLLRGRTV